MKIVPVTRQEARVFIAKHHSHNKPPSVCITQMGVEKDGELVGVAMLGRPLARPLCDGTTAEVIRSCCNGSAKNANSMLYGACARAAKALGYRRLVTYTLADEAGSALKATGWVADEELRPSRPTGWGNRGGARGSVLPDLFGEVSIPIGEKRRWWKALDGGDSEPLS